MTRISSVGRPAVAGRLPHLTFLGGYPDVPSFCRSSAAHYTDVVMLDDSLPDTDVVRAYQAIQERCPHAAVLVLGSQMSAHDIHRVIRAGAWGSCAKTNRCRTCWWWVSSTPARKLYLSPCRADRGLSQLAGPQSRLEQVLHLMARGHHVQSIARELGITDRAVYNPQAPARNLAVDTSGIVAEPCGAELLRGEG